MTPQELVEQYLKQHFPIVTWPAIGDSKGPREDGWPQKQYTIEDFRDGYRVGLKLGTEVEAGRYLHDVDIDWGEGSDVAVRLLPQTGFAFGRPSKKFSHCFYLLPEPLPSFRYEDIDKTCLLELRGTKTNGEIGMQTMVPPSIWSKDGKREPLAFSLDTSKRELAYIPDIGEFKRRVCLAAIGMLLARHLGHNGFGHEVQLAWSGFFLRAGIPVDELIAMGEGMCKPCNHIAPATIRATVAYTIDRLKAPGQKVSGGKVLAKILGENGKAVLARINEWLGRDNDFHRSGRKGHEGEIIKDSQENIQRALSLLAVELSYDTFAERLLISEDEAPPQLLRDSIRNRLWLQIDRDFHFRPSKEFYDIVLDDIVYANPFHPVQDYLTDLTWDGELRIDRWLEQYGGAEDSDYLRAISAIVLMAAVKRVMHPGCKYDEMLVLESEQGLNKSSALRALCPRDEWFSDDLPLNVEAKEVIERTLGKWIIEASELTGRRSDRDHLKSMLSRQVDGPARMAYARSPVERARQFIIVGTTNNAAYLADMTGARRFWPVKVGRFDIDGIREVRDQLWAEAVAREANGESIRLPEPLWGVAGEHQEQRREQDAWEIALEDTIEKIEPCSTGRKQITTANIWQVLGIEVSRRDRVGAMRISEIMQRLRFFRTKVYVDAKTQAGYQSVDVYQLPYDGSKKS